MHKIFRVVAFSVAFSFSGAAATYRVGVGGVFFSGSFFDDVDEDVDLSDTPVDAIPQLRDFCLQKAEEEASLIWQPATSLSGKTYGSFIAETPNLTDYFGYLLFLAEGLTNLNQVATLEGVPMINGKITIMIPSGAVVLKDGETSVSMHIHWKNENNQLSESGKNVEFTTYLHKV